MMRQVKPTDLGLVIRRVGSLDALPFYRKHGFVVLPSQPLRRPKYVLFDEGNRQLYIKAPKVLFVDLPEPVTERDLARKMFRGSQAEREKSAGVLEAVRAGGATHEAAIVWLSDENAPETMNCDSDLERLGDVRDGFVPSSVLMKVLS